MSGDRPALASTELETKTYSVSALLEAMRKGRVRIPRFQRGFRWSDEDRRLLLDSLQAGYPVGTLLLAQGEAPADRVALGGYAIDVPAIRDALWVVDGQQRLVTLAMALLEDHSGAYRPLYFDLETDRFVLGVRRRAAPPHWLPTGVLSSSAALNRWLRAAKLPDASCDRADDIARRIREYTVAAYLVPYDGKDDRLLKQIFARINRRGRALESHEVFQALHASVAGGKGPIDRVRDEVSALGFGAIAPAHVERTALAIAGGDPGRALQQQVAEADVPALFAEVARGLGRAVEFLAADVGVPHIDFLPYAGTLFTLARFFAKHPDPHPRNRELLVRWFWRGTLSGVHRTDNRLDRKNWQSIDADEHASLQRLLALLPKVDAASLPVALHQPFRRGVAQVDVEVIAAFALDPKVLVGPDRGADVPVAALVAAEQKVPWPLVETSSSRTTACFLLHPEVTVEELRASPPPAALLATHAIGEAAFAALVAGDVDAFVRARADALLAHLQGFLETRAALDAPDHDRPPLDAYFEESA